MQWNAGHEPVIPPLHAALFRATGLARETMNGGNTTSFLLERCVHRQAQP
jgi:hypothetical protein